MSWTPTPAPSIALLSPFSLSPILAQATSEQQLTGIAQPGPGATTGAPGSPAPAGGPPPASPGGGMGFLLLPLLLFGFLIFFQMSSARKEKKKREALMGGLKKHDKVITLGGIIATVAELRDDEVVLRVDENTNTKIRVTRAAIQQILAGDTAADSAAAAVEVKTKSPERVNA